MLRNLVTSLLDHERIETTDAKAKEVRRARRPHDHAGQAGRRCTPGARRSSVIRDKREITAKLFDVLAERFRERPGGYTRVLKIRQRIGDAAPLSIIELVDGNPGGSAGE